MSSSRKIHTTSTNQLMQEWAKTTNSPFPPCTCEDSCMALLMATGHGCKTAQAERSVKLQTGHLISRAEHGSSLLGAACLALLVACHLMVGCQPQRPCQASLASSRHGSPACFLWGNIHGLHKQNVSAKICCLSFFNSELKRITTKRQTQASGN
jgi:hypothetical protein